MWTSFCIFICDFSSFAFYTIGSSFPVLLSFVGLRIPFAFALSLYVLSSSSHICIIYPPLRVPHGTPLSTLNYLFASALPDAPLLISIGRGSSPLFCTVRRRPDGCCASLA